MRLRVSTIPQSGMVIEDTLPLDALNERMQLGRGDETTFLAAPTVKIELYPSRAGASLKGVIEASLRQSCALCAEGVDRTMSVKVDCQLLEKKDAASEDDVGTHYYENDAVDLEPILQEYLILTLSPFWHPDLDKGGKCTFCARSEEERQQLVGIGSAQGEGRRKKGSGESLGSLLARALEEGKN